MMRVTGLILIFVLALAGFAIANLPLAWVMGRAAERVPALEYQSASGTVWQGTVQGLRVGLQPLGRADVAVSPLSLFVGRVQADLSLQGPSLSGNGRLVVGLDGRARISDGRLRGQTGGLVGLVDQVRSLNGQFSASVDELVLSGTSCEAGRGRVSTDLLTRLERDWNWAGPALAGPLDCRDGRVVLDLDGETDTGDRVSIDLAAGLDLTGDLVARVTTPVPNAQVGLQSLGFIPEGEEYVYRRTMP